ncbi:MAG: hypothetical protein WAR57_11820, partial [Candidatus Phosphoribacter sp.]
LVIDELAEVVAAGVTRDEKRDDEERASLIRRLIAKGRAAGVVVVAATQKPSADVIPTGLRDLIAQRLAFETTSRAMTETILGAGVCDEAPAHRLAGAGQAWVISEGVKAARRMRVAWVPDDDVPPMAAATAALRVELPWLVGSAVPSMTAVSA